MGFFSWKTQDTNRSISNVYADKTVIPVYMCDDNGNQWHEPRYEGYGVFGGKDFYELLAEMNSLGSDRFKGITLAFSGKSFKSPNLYEEPLVGYRNSAPHNCEFQGYFYPLYQQSDYDSVNEMY